MRLIRTYVWLSHGGIGYTHGLRVIDTELGDGTEIVEDCPP